MKVIAIQKLLHGVLEKFFEQITEPSVIEALKHGYITGGCIPSMATDEYVNDFDLYLNNKEDVEIVKTYFEKLTDTISLDPPKFKVGLITENAINLDNKIQIIIKYYGPPEIITENFDWAHIKSWYSIMDNELILCPDFYKFIVEKDLIYTGSEYPLSSLLRTRKFIKKGWKVSTKTMTHIVLDICNAIGIMDSKSEYCLLDKETFKQSEDFHNNPNTLHFVSIDQFIHQLNGVDPLTIQQRLLQHTGEYLTISEIIKLL